MDITKIICHLRHKPSHKLPASPLACLLLRMHCRKPPASLPAYPMRRMLPASRLLHTLLPEPAGSSVSIRINLKVP
jgi:hypothetical protein